MQKIVFFDCMSMLLLWSWHSSVGRICQSCNFEQTMLLGWNSTGSYLLRIAGNWSWALFAPKLGHFCPEVKPFSPLKLESKCWINNTAYSTSWNWTTLKVKLSQALSDQLFVSSRSTRSFGLSTARGRGRFLKARSTWSACSVLVLTP